MRVRPDICAVCRECLGVWAWWPMLLATIYVRAVWHSVADNLSHHDVALDEPERARNYRLPRLLGVLLLNQHLHRTHHRHPTAAWVHLARLSKIEDSPHHGNYFRAALRQFGLAYPRIVENLALAGMCGKVLIVTGATSGLGKATALALAN